MMKVDYSGLEEFSNGRSRLIFKNQSSQSANMKSAILGEVGEYADHQELIDRLDGPGTEADLTFIPGALLKILPGREYLGRRDAV